MPHPDFDAFTRAPTSSKSSRPTGASATSRKNKLQRCSICGGLGHKSRTCDQSDQKRGAGLLSSLLQAEIEMDRCSSPDHRRLAADGLLTLSNEALWTGLTTTVAAESHLFGHHWPATSSPRMMEAGARRLYSLASGPLPRGRLCALVSSTPVSTGCAESFDRVRVLA